MVARLTCTLVLCALSCAAAAQEVAYRCQFDEATATVACVRTGESASVFEYAIAEYRASALPDTKAIPFTRAAHEQCRVQAEIFRKQELEGRLSDSIEEMRRAAEKLRQSSESNIELYRQIIVVYRSLRSNKYEQGLEIYKTTLAACMQSTPYPVVPQPRFSTSGVGQ